MSNTGNIIGGHKAALHNPNVSEEAKDHSRQVLKEEFDTTTEAPQNSGYVEAGKNPGNVAGGLKAAVHNPNVSDKAKDHSRQVLKEEFHTNAEGGGLTEDGKNIDNVARGLKSAIHNPNVSAEAKQSAEERLAELK